MNKLQAMEVFVQVVDAGSFVRTAEQMQLPKATVSTLIQSLESLLAVKLLHRTTRQVTVTADGAAFYERCVRILSDVREAEESTSRNRLTPSGPLRVDAPPGLVSELLLPNLPDFFTRYPDITLELGSSQQPVDLVENSVDCAMHCGILPDSNLIARRIGNLHTIACAAPSYLAQYGRPQHPEDLKRHRSVSYFSWKKEKTDEWAFTRRGERIQASVPSRLAVNDVHAGISAGLSGLGIIQMLDFTLAPLAADGRLERLLPEWTSDPVALHVVYPENRHVSAKVRVFVEWVAELCSGHPDIRLSRKAA